MKIVLHPQNMQVSNASLKEIHSVLYNKHYKTFIYKNKTLPKFSREGKIKSNLF